MSEQLELIGAIQILRRAKEVIPQSGWWGTEYREHTKAEREALDILDRLQMDARHRLEVMYRPTKPCSTCAGTGEVTNQ